jgi:type II secretory pathway predicted ATPase ExeA
MTDEIISDIKRQFESGGNWPYEFGTHRLDENPFAEQWPDIRLFAGYEDELRRLQENIQRNVNTFVTGPFGTGKTILTRTMYEILEDIDGYRPVFVRVQKGRYSKTMAKRILRELDEPVDSQAGQNELYEDIMDSLQTLYEEDIRAVIFYDEVINGSDGTLRQILHLQRDIDDWEPVLVFNGTAHMLDQIHSKIEPLSDRIGEEITLSGLDVDGAMELINKRLRYYCGASEWNEDGCTHDDGDVAPFSRESIELIHQDVTPYPRHIRRECNTVIEEAAKAGRADVDFDFVERVMSQSATRKVEELTETGLDVLDALHEHGQASANAVTNALDISPYHVQEALGELEKKGLVRATEAGRGLEYKLTHLAERELSNQRRS